MDKQLLLCLFFPFLFQRLFLYNKKNVEIEYLKMCVNFLRLNPRTAIAGHGITVIVLFRKVV